MEGAFSEVPTLRHKHQGVPHLPSRPPAPPGLHLPRLRQGKGNSLIRSFHSPAQSPYSFLPSHLQDIPSYLPTVGTSLYSLSRATSSISSRSAIASPIPRRQRQYSSPETSIEFNSLYIPTCKLDWISQDAVAASGRRHNQSFHLTEINSTIVHPRFIALPLEPLQLCIIPSLSATSSSDIAHD